MNLMNLDSRLQNGIQSVLASCGLQKHRASFPILPKQGWVFICSEPCNTPIFASGERRVKGWGR